MLWCDTKQKANINSLLILLMLSFDLEHKWVCLVSQLKTPITRPRRKATRKRLHRPPPPPPLKWRESNSSHRTNEWLSWRWRASTRPSKPSSKCTIATFDPSTRASVSSSTFQKFTSTTSTTPVGRPTFKARGEIRLWSHVRTCPLIIRAYAWKSSVEKLTSILPSSDMIETAPLSEQTRGK